MSVVFWCRSLQVINHTHGSWRGKFGEKGAKALPFTTVEAEEAHGIAPAGERRKQTLSRALAAA